MKGAFSTYISPTLVKDLEKNPELLRSGGEKKFMTVLFSDLKGYTAISEKLKPLELMKFMNEYLTEMTAIILDEKGTITQYAGDAIMACFGAPLETTDHANQAVRAALKMQERLRVRARPPWTAGHP